MASQNRASSRLLSLRQRLRFDLNDFAGVLQLLQRRKRRPANCFRAHELVFLDRIRCAAGRRILASAPTETMRRHQRAPVQACSLASRCLASRRLVQPLAPLAS